MRTTLSIIISSLVLLCGCNNISDNEGNIENIERTIDESYHYLSIKTHQSSMQIHNLLDSNSDKRISSLFEKYNIINKAYISVNADISLLKISPDDLCANDNKVIFEKINDYFSIISMNAGEKHRRNILEYIDKQFYANSYNEKGREFNDFDFKKLKLDILLIHQECLSLLFSDYSVG